MIDDLEPDEDEDEDEDENETITLDVHDSILGLTTRDGP